LTPSSASLVINQYGNRSIRSRSVFAHRLRMGRLRIAASKAPTKPSNFDSGTTRKFRLNKKISIRAVAMARVPLLPALGKIPWFNRKRPINRRPERQCPQPPQRLEKISPPATSPALCRGFAPCIQRPSSSRSWVSSLSCPKLSSARFRHGHTNSQKRIHIIDVEK